MTPELAEALRIRKKIPSDFKPDLNDMPTYEYLSRMMAMYLDLELSSRKYQDLKKHTSVLFGLDFYPSRNTLIEIKNESFPESMTFSDVGAWAEVSSLISNTVKKILLLKNMDEWKALSKHLKLEGAWGMDGASGQQKMRQKWDTESEYESDHVDLEDDKGSEIITQHKEVKSDDSVVSVSFKPIRLSADDQTIWRNKTPNSVHYCRPVEFQFIKETKQPVLNLYNRYEKEFQTPVICEIQRYKFKVELDFKCTMLDGKTCNVLKNQNSSRSCNICRVNPSKMNDLNYIKENHPPNPEYYRFGIFSLHCWI